MIQLLITLATLLPIGAQAAPAEAKKPAAGSAVVSTRTVAGLYTGDLSRDPFVAAASVSSGRRLSETVPGGTENVDIHGMTLRGIMKDSKIEYALFNSDNGGAYMLRGGKLFTDRNKPVPGITGRIKLKQKTVELITADRDVQVFRLGENEKEEATH